MNQIPVINKVEIKQKNRILKRLVEKPAGQKCKEWHRCKGTKEIITPVRQLWHSDTSQVHASY